MEVYGGAAGLNCVAELDGTALAQARALDGRMDRLDLPLFGLPVLVKDNIDVKACAPRRGVLRWMIMWRRRMRRWCARCARRA